MLVISLAVDHGKAKDSGGKDGATKGGPAQRESYRSYLSPARHRGTGRASHATAPVSVSGTCSVVPGSLSWKAAVRAIHVPGC